MVVGGGAAGVFAAIRAREVAPRLEVIVLEAHARPLGKVKISGGGRCNLTHACFDTERLIAHYPRGGAALRGLFRRFGPRETVQWFQAQGVKVKTEADGRMFPTTDDSQTIIDALLERARRAGVRMELRHPVSHIAREKGRFVFDDMAAERVIVATGGSRSGFAMTEALGHALVPPVPSLFTFNVKDPRLEGLAGVSVGHVQGRIDVAGHPPVRQEGPLLITHWGLSGPLVLRLSAWGARALHDAAYRARLQLDLIPTLPHDEVRVRLFAHKASGARKHIGNDPGLDLPRRLWQKLVEACDIPLDRWWSEAPQKGLNRLTEMVKQANFEIVGKGAFKEEFVTAGGVPLNEIDLRTMQSRKVPGLHFAGEIIDVDALTGGFNFQNAWTTGYVAGESAGS